MDARDKRMQERVEEAYSSDSGTPEREQGGSPAAHETTRHPVGAAQRALPGLLIPLSHVLTEDAHQDLARVSPARWRLRVHMYDPDAYAEALAQGMAPDKGDDDEMDGYVCVEKSRPVAHCQPDVLSWLQQREITGDLVLEWLPPPENRSRAVRHFVHVPTGHGFQSAAPTRPNSSQSHANPGTGQPIMKPSPAVGSQDFVQSILDRMADESRELRELVRHITDSQERTLTRFSEEQRHVINDLRDAWNEQLANDPRRKIGELVESKVTQRIVDEIGSEKTDPWAKLEKEFKHVEEMRGKLRQYFGDGDAKAVDPLEEKLTGAIADLGILYAKQKMGLPVGGADALNLAQRLGQLNTEGESLLKSLEGAA